MMTFLRKSLLYRTLAVFILVSMVPVFLVSVLNYFQSKKAIETKVLADLSKVVDTQTKIVTDWFAERKSNALLIAAGKEAHSDNLAEIQTYLADMAKNIPTIEDISIANNQGRVFIGSLAKLKGLDVSNRAYYKAALEGKFVFSDVLISKNSGNPIVIAAAPVLDAAGKTYRVVIIAIPLKELNRKLKLDNFGETGETYIVNKEGMFITESKFKPGAALKEKINTTAFKEGILGKVGIGIYRGYYNSNVLGAYRQVPGFQWALIAEQDEKEAFADITDMRNNMLVIALLTVLAAGFAGWVFSNRLVKPVQELVEGAKRLAEGDLNHDNPVNRSDEIGLLGQAFNEMTAGMRRMVVQVIDGAQQVAATSETLSVSAATATSSTRQVTVAMEGLTGNSSEQEAKIKEMAAVVGELLEAVGQIASGAQEQSGNIIKTSEETGVMTQRVTEVADWTQSMEEVARKSLVAAEEGGTAVGRTIEGMERVKEAVFSTANRIRELGEYSQQIGEIIQVIDDIAEQTNLLALNAAIEAARAGEHGKGFAVVADEVRKLAERSSKSTKEIANLIANIQKGTENAVSSMETGTAEVEKGVELANGAGIALHNIIDNVNENGKQIAAITTAIASIRQSSVQVNEAVDKIAAIAEETTAATEEMAAGGSVVKQVVDDVAKSVHLSLITTQDVTTSTEELFATAEGVSETANELTKLAESLKEQVNRFKV